MNEAEVEDGLDTILAAAKKYDAAMETEFKALKASWMTARQAAGEKIAAASALDGGTDAALSALDLVLMRVVFTTGLAFVGNEAMGPQLFDQSRLYPAGTAAEEEPGPTPAGPVAPSP